jgi:hypothetical protein
MPTKILPPPPVGCTALRCLQRLRLNPSPAAQVEAAVTYKQNVPQVPLQ